DYTPNGQVIIVGSFNGTITSGGKSLTSTGGSDNAFIFVFDSSSTSSFIQNKSSTLCIGDSVQIKTGISSGTFSWSPGSLLNDSTIASPTTRTSTSTNFVLKYTTPDGCVYYDTARVFYKACVSCDSSCNKTVGPNLLKNGDFEKGDSNFSASPYTYYSANPMTQGEYIITSNPAGCHFAYSGTDHTSGSGKMMVINGAMAFRGKFYTQSVSVKKNTCYKITAWLNNIVEASYTGLAEAHIRFRLNNDSSSNPVQVKQFPDQWIKLETTWFSDTCTVLNYMLDDTSSAGNGNDFAIDDLSVYECGCSVIYNTSAGPDTTICSGSSYTLPAPSGSKWKYTILSGDFSGLQGTNTANPNTKTRYLLTDSSASCNAYDTITVSVTTAPVLTHMANKTICRGDSVQLVTTAGYKYSWIPGSELSDSTIYNPFAKPNLSKDYKVIVSSGGCSSADSVSIVVNGKPASSKIIQTICKFDSLQLQANGPANTFSWAPSSGLSNPNIANPKASPITNTNYVCTMTNTSGCIGYDTVNLIVETVIANAGQDTTLCAGQNIQLSASGGVNYSWSPSNGLSNASISNPVASPSSSTSYIVSISAQYGCTKVDTINITVKNITVNASSDVTLCSGDSVQLFVTGGETYKWTPFAGLSDDTAFNPIAKPLTTTQYIVTGYTSNGCSRSDTVVVTVSNLNAFAGNDTTICGNDSIQLNATGGTTYSWSPTTGLNNPNISNPKALLSGNIDYIVFVTNGGSCSDYDTISITLLQKATVTSGGNIDICFGDSVQLDITGTGNYIWNTGEIDSSIVVAPSVNTRYTVVSNPSGFCISDTSIFNVFVRQKPTVSFIPDPKEGTKPLTVHFTNNTTNALSYLWRFGTGDTDIINSPTYIYQNTGTYNSTLIATNQYGCIDSASMTIIVRDSFYLFLPNSFTPNNNKKNDVFVIDYDKNNILEGYIKIYNRWGEKVYESDLLNYQPWDGTYRDKQVQEDVYLLILYVTDKNRTEYHHTATLTILR
ncbi:MAG: gliding motility-associated C-terminal domain-containing protein, partial [Bacteroidetes bacterium]|nr:gliding motility-associated C-terminal domain-containing protein [Bacteroidota bacterium]